MSISTEVGDSSILGPFGLALKRARQREDSHNAQTIYFPAAYDRDLYVTLAENVNRAIDRLKICAAEALSATSFEATVWRDLATTGAQVRVVYLVSHLGLLQSVLTDRIRLDVDAGIDVRVIAAQDLPDQIAQLQLGDTLVLDRRIAAYHNWVHDSSRDERGLWTISMSPEHVTQFSNTFSDIWESSVDPTSLPQRLDLEEPLVQSAQILAQVAPVLCKGDHIDSTSCDWYHGTWQFLRLMGLVSTPTWHNDFYTSWMAKAAERRTSTAPRILITGTADYSVLAYVLDSFKATPEAAVTVLDLCHTPLFACQWYAKRAGFSHLNLAPDDVFEFFDKDREPFDAIVTDAFLTRFPTELTTAIIRGWDHALTRNGQVITTIRVHSESEVGQTPEEAIASFRARAQIRWRRWAPFIDARAIEIADRAEIYARRMMSRPIGSQAEIITLLRQTFDIEHHELGSVPGELYPTKYLRVVLRKKSEV